MSTEQRPREHAHPTPARYVAIASILAVITIAEVVIIYQNLLEGVMMAVLIILSTAKFAMVAMFFMHLRFDSRLFSAMFVTGLLLAVILLIALLALFRVLTG